jgi:D-sedoheptulose 7-phosphate isomerase
MTSPVVQPDDASRVIARLGRYREQVADLLAVINLTAVSAAAEALRSARERGAVVYIAGNGGSATTASHMVTDLMFGRGLPEPGLRVIGLADNQAVITATANDVSYDEVFARQLRRLVRSGDVLILISASGNSPNVVRAAEVAREMEVTVIGLTGFDGGRLAGLSDVSVHVPSPPDAYGPVEDVHLIVNHMLVAALSSPEPGTGEIGRTDAEGRHSG